MADLPFKTHLFPTTPISGLEFSGPHTHSYFLKTTAMAHAISMFMRIPLFSWKLLIQGSQGFLIIRESQRPALALYDQTLSESSYKDLLRAYEVDTRLLHVTGNRKSTCRYICTLSCSHRRTPITTPCQNPPIYHSEFGEVGKTWTLLQNSLGGIQALLLCDFKWVI